MSGCPPSAPQDGVEPARLSVLSHSLLKPGRWQDKCTPDKEGGLVSSRDLATVTGQAGAQVTEQHHSAPTHTSHRTAPVPA